MFDCPSRSQCYLLCAAAVAILLWIGAGTAPAQVLFSENFDDDILEENAMVNANVTIAGGIALFDDPADGRATFSVVQDFTDPVMTFSFDVVEPVVQTAPPAQMELVIRAGTGTAHNTLQNADHIAETIVYRNGNRGDYMNNGDETIFMVANNNASELTFTSPIDNVTQLMVPGFHSRSFVRDNTTGMFGAFGGNNDFRPENAEFFGTFNRFAIGSSSTGHVGTFSLDNVLVVSGVSFEQDIGPPPVLGDTNDNGIGGEFPDDFEPIRANFRMNVASRMEGDLVRDGFVDFADFREWKAAFLDGGGSLAEIELGFLTNVPEPSTFGLLLWAAFAAAATRKKREHHRCRRLYGGS